MKEQEENTSASVCVCLSLSAYIMNENVLGGLVTSNRTELGATFVFVFLDKCCHFLTQKIGNLC
jgi:hypothetical protein